MREVNHENLCPFLGMCVDPPNVCFVTTFCSKGSLEDIIHNDIIKIDLNFKSSFIYDIIHGMEYLHKSAIKSHGRLKSSNCVVDGRWVLKITDWGLSHFRDVPELEDAKFRGLYWTAPEILGDPNAPAQGTQKGDVYSFAIVMLEVMFSIHPFQGGDGQYSMVPKDIIGRVRNGETPPFRPPIPVTNETDHRLLSLMTLCWAEDPAQRPDFLAIKAKFDNMNKGKRFNIMDNMLKMMEKYANNLEELVADRTRQLEVEKKKTDALLYRMLPSSVADSLKIGEPVTPKLYKDVAIYFSDIVQFTNLSSESSPMEVVDLLNDLWTLFDDVIECYDIYKVETIGDAYMVASGVPEPKAGLHHACEIANMALDILSSILGFKVRHRPGMQLKVRIGIHIGNCVAGVIGLTMPRYCLFGDTVNTASRMESNGEALKIHISAQFNDFLTKAPKPYYTVKRGDIELKGKGIQTTYWLQGREGYDKPLPTFD